MTLHLLTAQKNVPGFEPGIITLVRDHLDRISHIRVGLVSHRAAVNRQGLSTAELLHSTPGITLAALFGPEHGFAVSCAAGESAPDAMHPDWHIPIFSLYGARRRPDISIFATIDLLIYDIQDIGARPYTYVSTLRACLEVAADARIPVIIADRPTPLPNTVDGPLRDSAVESFVCAVNTPMAYGMTPGETALWLARDLGLDLDLGIAMMSGYHRQPARGSDWSAWIPPSPRIHTWATGQCFTATVFAEGLAAVDNGSGLPLVFQILGCPLRSPGIIKDGLSGIALPGARLHPHEFQPTAGPYTGQTMGGVRIEISNPDVFQPVLTAVSLIARLQEICGKDPLWSVAGTRPGFFDQLFGSPSVREALLSGTTPTAIADAWKQSYQPFLETRQKCLLYQNR